MNAFQRPLMTQISEITTHALKGFKKVYKNRMGRMGFVRRAVQGGLLLGLAASAAHAATATVLAGKTVRLGVTASGSAPFTYQWYKNSAAISGATSSSLALSNLSTNDSGSYQVLVSNAGGSSYSDIASITVQAVSAPSITSQPSSVTVSAGSAASFSVSVSGTAPFTYQWYKNGNVISGATAASYSIASASTNDAGSYMVSVTNSVNTVYSSSATLTVTSQAVAPVASATFGDSSFENVGVGSGNYSSFAYNPTGSSWTFASNAGLTGNSSGFTVSNSNAPDGSQVAFIQCQGSIYTSVNFPAGTYSITGLAANRQNWGGAQAVNVYVDNNYVGTFTAGAQYSAVSTSPFTVGAGSHTVSFVGQTTADCTLFLDKLALVASSSVAVTSSGFESPSVGSNDYSAFMYNPGTSTNQAWTFQGDSGVTGNNSGFTSGNGNAPEGQQVAFLQDNTAVISQTISFPTGATYTLSCKAAQRGNWQFGTQTAAVYVDNVLVGNLTPNGTSYQDLSVAFVVTAGSHVVSLRGTASGDATLFLDQVQIR